MAINKSMRRVLKALSFDGIVQRHEAPLPFVQQLKINISK